VRLATLRLGGKTAAVVVDGERFSVVAAPDVGTVLATGGLASIPHIQGRLDPLRLADLAPVVPHPPKILCLGHNFRSHVQEMGRDLPTHPTLFAKFARALIGPRDRILLPRQSRQVDWEAELGVIIGSEARNAERDEAEAAIAGYTIVNDISARDWQSRTSQWLQGKNFEATTPIGPWMVTPDELDVSDLEIRCEVDGTVVQKANTSDFIFGPAEVVSYISQFVTLEPGDLISMGTPAGVGAARKPPVFLRAGQVGRTSIEGIGYLVNECAEWDG
jgi:acylpyruvate hydrolase